MNKIFKSTLIAVVATMGLATTSCTNEYSYDAAAASGEQVYFGSDMSTTVETPKSASSFSVTVRRINTQGTVTVPVTITQSEGSIYTPVAQQVTFADGADSAPLTFNYNPDDVVYGTYYDITVQLNETSFGSPYGLTSYSFKAGATAWVDFGKASYREDFVGTFFGKVDNVIYDVPIQRNTVEEGMYRLVNPYGKAYPYNADGDYDTTQDYYLTINAQDPTKVFIEKSPSGMDWSYGAFTMSSIPAFYMERQGLTADEARATYGAYCGTLEDGVITMPAKSLLISMANYQEGGFYQGGTGLFAVALPGYAIADLSAEVSYAGIFTDADNQIFAVANLTLGEDVKNAKAVVVPADADADAVADAIAAGEVDAIDVIAGSIQVPVAEDLTGKLQIVVVVLDDDNAVKTVVVAPFEYYGGGGNPWKSLGEGYFVDDVILPLFGYEAEKYPVEIQESTETPGLYRLVAMYSAVAADFGVESGTGDVLVHAEEADGVYIPLQPLELTLGNNGPFSISTDAGELVTKYGYDAVKAQLPEIFGTLSDGVISFPVLEEESSQGNKVQYQLWIIMNDKHYFAGRSGSFQIVLPGAAASAKAKALARAASFERRLKGMSITNAVRPTVKKINKMATPAPMYLK